MTHCIVPFHLIFAFIFHITNFVLFLFQHFFFCSVLWYSMFVHVVQNISNENMFHFHLDSVHVTHDSQTQMNKWISINMGIDIHQSVPCYTSYTIVRDIRYIRWYDLVNNYNKMSNCVTLFHFLPFNSFQQWCDFFRLNAFRMRYLVINYIPTRLEMYRLYYNCRNN